MTQWGSFLVGTLVILTVVLVLARQSQSIIEEQTAERQSTADGISPEIPSVEPSASVDENEVETDVDDSFVPPAKRQSQPEQKLVFTPWMLQVNVAVTQGLVAALVIVAGWYFEIPAAAFGITAEPISTGWPAVVVGIGFGLVLWLFNEGATRLADVVGASYDEGVRELLAPATTGGWVVLFGVVLPLIALSEELLFRAALIGVPAAGFEISPWALAVGTSAAFALGHGAQGRVGILVTGILGFVLAAGYIVTGSLLLVIVAHYVINAMEFFTHEYL